jgi:hypothetical protein
LFVGKPCGVPSSLFIGPWMIILVDSTA